MSSTPKTPAAISLHAARLRDVAMQIPKGTPDHEDLLSAAEVMEANDPVQLRNILLGLDTSCRDLVLNHIAPDLWPSIGYKPLDLARSVQQYRERFGQKAEDTAEETPAGPTP